MFTVTTAQLDGWLAGFVYPFFRIIALASSAPLFSHPSVPRVARIGLALLVTALVAPALPSIAAVSPFSWTGAGLVVQQIVVGVAVGLAMQIVFAAVQIAGDLIGLTMGLSFAGFVDPQNNADSPAVGTFLSLVLMLLFLSVNGHLLLIAALADTFRAFPVGGAGLSALDARALVAAGSELFALGLKLALPVVAALLLANIALGVLTRTAPQLNLFAVGFPVTLIVGLLMLLVALPFVFPALEHGVQWALTLVRR
jgi:flagellar biosynthetic protein FliR